VPEHALVGHELTDAPEYRRRKPEDIGVDINRGKSTPLRVDVFASERDAS
jgi:hypothetical protein